MSARSRHGNARRFGLGPVIETMPPNEQPQPQAAGADPIASGRDRSGKVRTREAAAAMARLPRKPRYLPAAVASHPDFKKHDTRRREWLVRRRAEHHAAHGGVSHGVGAMLNAAAWLWAGADFSAEKAAETGDVEWFKVSANLATAARGQDWSAWELGARESLVRAKQGRGRTLAEEIMASAPPRGADGS